MTSIQYSIKNITRSGISKLNIVNNCNSGLYFPQIEKEDVSCTNKNMRDNNTSNELKLIENIIEPDGIASSPLCSSFMKEIQKRMDFYYSYNESNGK